MLSSINEEKLINQEESDNVMTGKQTLHNTVK